MNRTGALWKTASDVAAVVERWLRENEGKAFYMRLKRTDLLRLTRLQVWSWRHCVDVDEILTLTLPYLRKSLRSTQKAGYGLGCSIAALTGVGNEKILVQALAQIDPDGARIAEWRQREQERQLEREALEDADGLPVRPRPVKGIFDHDSVSSFVQSYRRDVMRQRDKSNAQLMSPKRKRKAYRGNPWR